MPIDVSATFLSQTAAQLRREYPGLTVEPAVADIAEELNLPRRMPRPALFAFLGSTIGNFYPPAAIRLLARVRAAMEPGDRFLMGVDLRKDIARIEAAYNDSQGVTAEFNRNMLLVLNHELGADFDPAAFEHRAFYDRVAHRIEMHLVSTRDQAVDDSRTRAGPASPRASRSAPRSAPSTTATASPRCSPPPGSGSRPGRPIPRRRSAWWSERRA